jgi:HEAT repeat protein
MPYQSDGYTFGNELAGKSIEDILLLIGDEEQLSKSLAMEKVVGMGLEAVYPTLEKAIRNDENADLRNGAMEVFVKFGARAIPKLIRLLRDKNEEVRNFSTVMLGDIGSREAVGPLIKALQDPDANVRHGAAEALGKIGDRAALVPLLDLLKDDFWQQYPAIVAMGEMRDDRAVPNLLQLLNEEMLIEPVIEALGKIGDPRSLLPLMEIIGEQSAAHSAAATRAVVAIQKSLNDGYRYKNSLVDYGQSIPLANLISLQGIANLKGLMHLEGDKETVAAAITLLGWRGDIAVLPEFFSLLEHDDYLEAIESAILSIGRPASRPLLDALCHNFVNVRTAALRTLRWMGAIDDYKVLLPILSDEDEKVKIEVLEALKGVTDDAFLPALKQLLTEGSEEVKTRALEVFSQYPFTKTQTTLVSLITGEGYEERKYGAMLFGLMSGGDCKLLEPLFRDESDAVRNEAVKAAGRRKLPDALPLLREALSDTAISVREEAVYALAEFGDLIPLADILNLLGKDCERVDYAIIKAVGLIGSREAGPFLVTYLKNGEVPRLLEFAIIETLGKLEGKGEPERSAVAGYLTHDDPDIRRLAIMTLERIAGLDALPSMFEACSDPHWSVRIAALQALGKIGGDKVIPPLLNALADTDPMVRKNAILVLGNLRNIRTIPSLIRQLTDLEMSKYSFEALLKFGRTGLPWLHRVLKGSFSTEVRERVIDLIGKIGDSKSVESLLEMLEDSNPAIRLAAIDSLVFCFNSVPLKRLSQLKKLDASEEVKNKAELALKTLTMEKFF